MRFTDVGRTLSFTSWSANVANIDRLAERGNRFLERRVNPRVRFQFILRRLVTTADNLDHAFLGFGHACILCWTSEPCWRSRLKSTLDSCRRMGGISLRQHYSKSGPLGRVTC